MLTEPCFFNFCLLATVTAPPIFHFVFNIWRDWRFIFKRSSPQCFLFQIAYWYQTNNSWILLLSSPIASYSIKMIHEAIGSHKKRTLPLISNRVSRNLKKYSEQAIAMYCLLNSFLAQAYRKLRPLRVFLHLLTDDHSYKNVPKKTIMSYKLFVTQLDRVSNNSKCNDEMIWTKV